MTASFIAMFVIASAYGLYIMGWRWWTEISPAIEAQRVARIAVTGIITGTVDPTEGTDTISSIIYSRRNGIAAAMFDADNLPPSTPVISGDNTRIDFRSEADNSNARAYYIATDAQTGDKFIYYSNNAGGVKRIDSTRGVTALEIRFYVDGIGVTRYNIIQVKAKADKDIIGPRSQAYPVRVEYTDYVYLKNKL